MSLIPLGVWAASGGEPVTFNINFLVVGGGGGGGANDNTQPGGGGAGGFRTSFGASGGGASAESALSVLTGESYTVTIGAPGQGGIAQTTTWSTEGGNSVLSTITSIGGGRGSTGTSTGWQPATVGGSGGGGSGGSTSGAAGTADQGFAGGDSNGPTGGGGGGAGAAGSIGTGGTGQASSITGTSVTYARGGDGGSAGTSVSANTGDGGYAGDPGSAGGSGVVIIKYPDTISVSVGAGLTSSTASPSGGFIVTSILSGSGTISFS